VDNWAGEYHYYSRIRNQYLKELLCEEDGVLWIVGCEGWGECGVIDFAYIPRFYFFAYLLVHLLFIS
jgi:hypothetical protein